MDVTTARTFLAAAATGSFLAAARRVNASPPTVTERIKQLEHLLSVRLFERDKRGCRLTPAGHRLVEPARNLVRAWEDGCARVALPPQFERIIRIGGQHALWPSLLIPWLTHVRLEVPEIAFRATAAAPAQLNQAIQENDLDMTFLYDPVHRDGIYIAEIAPDRLVLVTANPNVSWKDNYVRIFWGDSANAELNARLGVVPAPGLELDLGVLSLEWLVATCSSGYVPERLAQRHFDAGTLFPVSTEPSIEFSPFVCWRTSLDGEIADRLIWLARRQYVEFGSI